MKSLGDCASQKANPVPCQMQVSLDQYHTEEEIYQMSLQREPRKPVVRTLTPKGFEQVFWTHNDLHNKPIMAMLY